MEIVIEVTLKPEVTYLLDNNGAIITLKENDSNCVTMHIEVPRVTAHEVSKDFVAFLIMDIVYNLRDIEKFEVIKPKIY